MRRLTVRLESNHACSTRMMRVGKSGFITGPGTSVFNWSRPEVGKLAHHSKVGHRQQMRSSTGKWLLLTAQRRKNSSVVMKW